MPNFVVNVNLFLSFVQRWRLKGWFTLSFCSCWSPALFVFDWDLLLLFLTCSWLF